MTVNPAVVRTPSEQPLHSYCFHYLCPFHQEDSGVVLVENGSNLSPPSLFFFFKGQKLPANKFQQVLFLPYLTNTH